MLFFLCMVVLVLSVNSEVLTLSIYSRTQPGFERGPREVDADVSLVVVTKFAPDAARRCRAKSSGCKVRSPDWLGDIS